MTRLLNQSTRRLPTPRRKRSVHNGMGLMISWFIFGLLVITFAGKLSVIIDAAIMLLAAALGS